MSNAISVKKVSIFLRDKNLNVREVGSGRIYDQKVTPDVMTAMCSVIVAHAGRESALADSTFTIKDLWETPEFNEIVTGVFTKPNAITDVAHHEYDKFIGQPLHVLYHAGILSQKRQGNTLLYTVKEPKWVSLLAHSEENCVVFLWHYIEKMLEESGILNKFADFYSNPNAQTYSVALRAYTDLFLQHTPINGETEIRRIFAKVMGHHILPKSIYPELSNLRENIIVLTPNQHRVAHRKGAHDVNPGFQLFCLIRKIDSIEACEKDPGCVFYDVSIFKKMLSALGIPNADRREHNFDDLRRIVMAHYTRSN